LDGSADTEPATALNASKLAKRQTLLSVEGVLKVNGCVYGPVWYLLALKKKNHRNSYCEVAV
jgi:hypothetical protein